MVRQSILGFDWEDGPFAYAQLAAKATALVTAGCWIQRAYGSDNQIKVQILDGATWRTVYEGSGSWESCSVISDGTNVRVLNDDAANPKWYGYCSIQKRTGRA